jgi:hypothetical protein
MDATFWAVQSVPDKKCPLYKCAVIDRKYRDCGECAELPCKTFIDMKDPNTSNGQHKKSIGERGGRLR